MNEFEKNIFGTNNEENEEINITNDVEITEAEEADCDIVMPAEETEVTERLVWNTDDYQTNMPVAVVKKNPFNVKVKKSSMKKYIAIAVAAAIVNMAALGGLFAVGYNMGRGRIGGGDKARAIASINGGASGSNGMRNTVSTGDELTTVEISKKVGPSVVGIISTVQGMMSIFGTTTTAEGSGSGIIISEDGYIVTNNHVIDGASSIRVALNTGGEYEAKVIGTDPKTDLAVIKIQPEETLTVAELGDSSQVEVGERAVAIGNPLGMEFFGSTTQGIISAINRTISVENRTMNVIQTDAAINEGNSGGALVDAYGKVIGINAVKIASSSVEGMGFAIPISEARPIIEDLIQHGYVKGRPVMGISSRDVTEYMSQRQGWPVGVQVMATSVGSGAEIAGLEQGDIITKADGKEVKTTDELNKIKDTHKPGENMTLEVYKYQTGLKTTVRVKLTEERPN